MSINKEQCKTQCINLDKCPRANCIFKHPPNWNPRYNKWCCNTVCDKCKEYNICVYYIKGNCEKGDYCKLEHISPPAYSE